MQNQNNALLHRGVSNRKIKQTLYSFCLNLIHHPLKIGVLLISICIYDYLRNGIYCRLYKYTYSDWICFPFTLMLTVIYFIVVIIILSSPVKRNNYVQALARIGFTNSLAETPLFLVDYKYKALYTMRFESQGIILDEWLDRIPHIENTLNITIATINNGNRARDIIITYIKGHHLLDNTIMWKGDMLTGNGTLILGECFNNVVSVSLVDYPHLLIAGATGSGKTVLLKLLLMQCINKNFRIVIADFKGGVDYSGIWHEKCIFLDNETKTLDVLKQIISEKNKRVELFRVNNVKNIDEYNQRNNMKLRRIIFACDELAELLDTNGLTKEEKAIKQEISRQISSIARLGRAFGIHLILSTQRPDADILNGQIKNNITYRICGKADDILSRIILDNTSASERIPSDSKGIFINQDGTIFKGYMFNEDKDIH